MSKSKIDGSNQLFNLSLKFNDETELSEVKLTATIGNERMDCERYFHSGSEAVQFIQEQLKEFGWEIDE